MAAAEKKITLQRLEQTELEIKVVGTTPLISHAWSQKAKEMMLAKQRGETVVKLPKDPEQDFKDSIYRLTDGGYGFPATGFKNATVSGARLYKGSVTMTALRPMLYVVPDDRYTGLVEIKGDPTIREDMVRLESGVADIRFRAEYKDWSATLRVRFPSHMIDESAVVALVDAGGSTGIGDWRPEKSGIFGTYQVVDG